MFEPDAYTTIISSNGNGRAFINQMQFRWAAIASVSLSGVEYQAAIFWDQNNYLDVATRQAGGVWTVYVTSISMTPDDLHRIAVLGIDPNGYIHIDYGHPGNGDALKYRRSNNPINTFNGTFTAVLSMLGGVPETNVIYPEFANDPAGNLYFLFTTEAYGFDGKLYMYKYDHAATTWAGAAGTTGGLLIDAIAVGNHALYTNRAVFDYNFGSGGYFHLSWCWQVDSVDLDGRYDPSYVKWDGTNWKQSGGASQTIPITTGNSETIETVAIHNYLRARGVTASDKNGHPHVAYSKKGGDGFSHLYHAWHNGSSWTVTQVTTTSAGPQGDNSFPYLFSYPDLAIRGNDNRAFIVFWDNLQGTGVYIALADAPYTTWSISNIYPNTAGIWGPKHDQYVWENHSRLDLLIENWDGNNYLPGSAGPWPVRLLEYAPTATYGPHLKSGANFLKSGASFLTN